MKGKKGTLRFGRDSNTRNSLGSIGQRLSLLESRRWEEPGPQTSELEHCPVGLRILELREGVPSSHLLLN